jgi:Cellulase (glycosyl hydrolase family 5)
MKRPLFVLGFLTAASASLTARLPQPDTSRFVQAQGRRLVGPDGRPFLIKGIGLGNWLVPEGYMFHLDKGPASPRHIEQLVQSLVGPDEARAFWRAWRERYVTRADLELLKHVGFNTVRLPFDYRPFLSDERPETFDELAFAPLDRVVRWSRELGLYVVLDMHAAPGGQTGTNIDDSTGAPWLFESAESRDRMTMLWRRIAERYRDEPAVLGYELLNEPIAPNRDWTRYNAQLEPLYRQVTGAIRAVDPAHIVVLGGAQWNTNFAVFTAPFAPNLVYAFHKYWSETTETSIEDYLTFRQRYDVPIWLGETGENNDEWIAAATELAESHDIGWAFWPYKKMDATSSVVSFDRPAGWDAVVAFAQVSPYDYEAGTKVRPAPEDARRMLRELLDNVQFSRCRVNPGYIRAMGLTP